MRQVLHHTERDSIQQGEETMTKSWRSWAGGVIIALLGITLLVAAEQSADQPSASEEGLSQTGAPPWATDLPREIFPSGVPRSPDEVDLVSLTAGTTLGKMLTGEKPIEQWSPVFIDPPNEGSVEYSYRCNLLVNAAWDLGFLYPDRPLSEDPTELLSSPTLLWRLKHLEPAGPVVRDALTTVVKGKRSTIPSQERYELEVGKSLRPGQFMLVLDLTYPDVSLVTPAMVVCRPDPEKIRAYSAVIWLQTRDSFEKTQWYPAIRGMYWGSIVRNLRQGAAIYYTETGGKMPKTRQDFAEVLGPENPKAWNPAVEKFVEVVLPQLTPAMFRPVEDYEAILRRIQENPGAK